MTVVDEMTEKPKLNVKVLRVSPIYNSSHAFLNKYYAEVEDHELHRVYTVEIGPNASPTQTIDLAVEAFRDKYNRERRWNEALEAAKNLEGKEL